MKVVVQQAITFHQSGGADRTLDSTTLLRTWGALQGRLPVCLDHLDRTLGADLRDWKKIRISHYSIQNRVLATPSQPLKCFERLGYQKRKCIVLERHTFVLKLADASVRCVVSHEVSARDFDIIDELINLYDAG